MGPIWTKILPSKDWFKILWYVLTNQSCRPAVCEQALSIISIFSIAYLLSFLSFLEALIVTLWFSVASLIFTQHVLSLSKRNLLHEAVLEWSSARFVCAYTSYVLYSKAEISQWLVRQEVVEIRGTEGKYFLSMIVWFTCSISFPCQ